MGQESRSITAGLTTSHSPPEADEIEVSLVGPGYGECVLIHIGDHRWVIVDSCLGPDRQPAALTYLRDLGLDPTEAVCLIVTTHWHDDHIRGMAQLVEACTNATFCSAAALVESEFLARLGALERVPATPSGSGAKELFNVLSLLAERSSIPSYALANRLIYNQDGCQIWSLSPSDSAFETFLRRIRSLVPDIDESKVRVPSLTPNDTSVVLLINVGKTVVLLGADLERRGWLAILDHDQGVHQRASVFKVPHHGSEDAHEDRVWSEMLQESPVAALTPWRRGRGALPTEDGIRSILRFTDMAYITATPSPPASRSMHDRSRLVARTIRESGVTLRDISPSHGMIRLRKKVDSTAGWGVEKIGAAQDLAAIL